MSKKKKNSSKEKDIQKIKETVEVNKEIDAKKDENVEVKEANIEKVKKSEKKKINWMTIFKEIAYWVFFALLILFFDYLEFNTTEKAEATYFLSLDAKRIQAFVVLFIFALVFDIILHIIKFEKLKIHIKFAILATAIAICYCIAVPVGQGTDEFSHYLRVYEISKKYTTLNYEETSEFPTEFGLLAGYKADDSTSYETYKVGFESFEMNSEEKIDLLEYYWNIRLYSPIQYLPQAIGVTIGRVLSDNILIIGLFGRIGGFIAWLLLCTYAIKIIPNKKIFFIILCLLPVNIFSAICISGDTITNAACMLFLAMIYRKFYLKEKVNRKDKIILLVSAILIALCKIVYLPFVFLILLLKPENFETKKSFRIFVIVLILISCIIGLGWLVVSSNSLKNSNVESSNQVKFILENPLKYFLIVIHTLEEKGTDYIYQFTTGYELMCNGKTVIYPIISYAYSIAVIMSLFVNTENKDTKLNRFRKFFVGCIIAGTSALICTAIYIQWTSLFEIGRYMIAGLQGRYFIPVAILLMFIIDNTKLSMKSENLISFVTIMQIPVLAQIMSTFVK